MTFGRDLLAIEMAAQLRRRLAGEGPPVLGVFVKFASSEVVELVAAAGFDVAILDREHSQLSEAEVCRLVSHGAAIGLATVVRVPDVERGSLNRLLEAGAAGFQLSMTVQRSQVDELISLTRYPPEGTRSIHLGHAGAGHGRIPLPTYLDRVAGGPLVIPQIETATTRPPLAELVEGCDVAFCGVTDLSVDLGVPGQLAHHRVTDRVREVAAAAATRNPTVALGMFVAGPAQVAEAVMLGARYIAVGSDMALLASSLRRVREDIDGAVGSG